VWTKKVILYHRTLDLPNETIMKKLESLRKYLPDPPSLNDFNTLTHDREGNDRSAEVILACQLHTNGGPVRQQHERADRQG
jgi:hypothetical protein